MRLAFVWLVISSAFFAWAPAQAVGISPLRFTTSIDPGKEQILAVKVTNDESTAITYTASVGGVKQDEQGRPIFGDDLDLAEKWITVDRATFRLAPKETKTIFFTVAVPSGSEPGTHTAALLVAPAAESNSSVGLTTRAAALATIYVAGRVQEGLVINQWRVTYQANQQLLATDIALFNNGTVSVSAVGRVTVTNVLGQILASSTVPLGNTILPGSKRQLAPVIPIRLAGGPNKVTLDIRYGRSSAISSAAVTIWHIPGWWYAVGSAVVVLFAVVRRGRKRK